MDYTEMTPEQLIEELQKRDITISEMESAKTPDSGDVATINAQAEISSLKTELEEVKKAAKAQEEELKKTKELNFTLGRQVARGATEVNTEEALHGLFGRKEK